MPIVKAKDPQRVNMRREQLERFLASSSTVSEWCALNKVSESTFYKWMAYFREMEPESFGSGNASRWIEVSRTELSASTALAVKADTSASPAVASARQAGQIASAIVPSAITARVNGVELSIPPGTAESDVAAVMRAAVSL